MMEETVKNTEKVKAKPKKSKNKKKMDKVDKTTTVLDNSSKSNPSPPPVLSPQAPSVSEQFDVSGSETLNKKHATPSTSIPDSSVGLNSAPNQLVTKSGPAPKPVPVESGRVLRPRKSTTSNPAEEVEDEEEDAKDGKPKRRRRRNRKRNKAVSPPVAVVDPEAANKNKIHTDMLQAYKKLASSPNEDTQTKIDSNGISDKTAESSVLKKDNIEQPKLTQQQKVKKPKPKPVTTPSGSATASSSTKMAKKSISKGPLVPAIAAGDTGTNNAKHRSSGVGRKSYTISEDGKLLLLVDVADNQGHGLPFPIREIEKKETPEKLNAKLGSKHGSKIDDMMPGPSQQIWHTDDDDEEPDSPPPELQPEVDKVGEDVAGGESHPPQAKCAKTAATPKGGIMKPLKYTEEELGKLYKPNRFFIRRSDLTNKSKPREPIYYVFRWLIGQDGRNLLTRYEPRMQPNKTVYHVATAMGYYIKEIDQDFYMEWQPVYFRVCLGTYSVPHMVYVFWKDNILRCLAYVYDWEENEFRFEGLLRILCGQVYSDTINIFLEQGDEHLGKQILMFFDKEIERLSSQILDGERWNRKNLDDVKRWPWVRVSLSNVDKSRPCDFCLPIFNRTPMKTLEVSGSPYDYIYLYELKDVKLQPPERPYQCCYLCAELLPIGHRVYHFKYFLHYTIGWIYRKRLTPELSGNKLAGEIIQSKDGCWLESLYIKSRIILGEGNRIIPDVEKEHRNLEKLLKKKEEGGSKRGKFNRQNSN